MSDLKIRIGVAAGAGATDDAANYLALVDALDDLGFDSIWVPDVVTAKVFDPGHTVGVGMAGLTERIEAFVEAGFSKFVIRPAEPPSSWTEAVASVADIVDLQT